MKQISEDNRLGTQQESSPSDLPPKNTKIKAPAPDLSALSTLGKNIESDPAMQDLANYLRGRAALAKNRAGTARQYFEKALQQLPSPENPLRPHILFHHALCLEKLHRREPAESGLITALDAGYLPESQDDALQAARILLRMNQPNRALPFLEAIVLKQPSPKADAWDMLGRAHQALHQYRRAISAYSQSIEIAPHKTATRALRAGLFRQLGQFELAEADYKKALQEEPENPDLHYALGLLQIRIHSLHLAYQSLLKATDSDSIPPLNYLFLALLAHANKEQDPAQNHLTHYLEISHKGSVEESADYLQYCINTADGNKEQALHTSVKKPKVPKPPPRSAPTLPTARIKRPARNSSTSPASQTIRSRQNNKSAKPPTGWHNTNGTLAASKPTENSCKSLCATDPPNSSSTTLPNWNTNA